MIRDGISDKFTRLPKFDQSRLLITDILSVLSFTYTDILEITDISGGNNWIIADT